MRHGAGLIVRVEGVWGVEKYALFPCNPVPVPVGFGPLSNPFVYCAVITDFQA